MPATTLNLLAAAWLQFEVHDWFSHGKNETEDPWRSCRSPTTTRGPSTRCGSSAPGRDPSADPTGPPTFLNTETHWWDASQVYGSEPAASPRRCARGEDGKLKLVERRPAAPTRSRSHVDLSTVAGNWWLGLALLHTLFMREHNAICDRLHETHPELGRRRAVRQGAAGQRGADRQDPHVEWTPAIIAHPTPSDALRANWWGLAGEGLAQAVRPAHHERRV